MTVTKAHKYLSAKTILARKDGYKTLLPCHCKQLVADYTELFGTAERVSKEIIRDHGRKVLGIVLDLVQSEMSDDEFMAILNRCE